jgi:RecJ-like exonuclease
MNGFKKKSFTKKTFNAKSSKKPWASKSSNKTKELFEKNNFVKPMQEKKIEELDLTKKEKVNITGRINRIVQTGGPTVFFVSDGTGTISLKAFVGAGQRAYPELSEDSIIKATISVGEFQGELEGTILKIKIIEGEQKDKFLESIRQIELKRAQVKPPEFLVKSKILDKLRETFIKAAVQVRLAIIQDRPIIVRHHNDSDGYCSGFVLERAILPLVEKQHNSPKAGWEFFKRAPCAAPFYEIDDSIRDTADSLRNVAKFSNKMPLIIIADNGSSPEDLMAIKQGKIHGTDFIVVDHHYFDKDVISSEVLAHINPFLVGEDGAKFSAGMLATEFARFINPELQNYEQIPAMAGFADRIDLNDPKIVNDYLKIAEEKGYSKELLSDISLVIEYVSSKIRFMEVREYIEVLFGEPRDKQKELVKLMSPYIRELDKKGLEIGKVNAIKEKIGETTLQMLYVDKTFPGFGFFPKPGRAVGLVHDDLKQSGVINLVSIGIMNTAITIRATDEANFSVHELLHFLGEKQPNAFVSGGGHKNAGSISFLPNKQEEVVNLLKEFIRKR